MKKLQLLAMAFFVISTTLTAQEICNNGIDDDNDGLIDLNDDECICEAFVPSSLIPNPSFEEMSCCPMNEAMLNCADTWIQASVPTTDYVHNCGFLGLPFINAEAPQPFPDGEGGVGFRDGKPGSPNFKEYTGACLMEPLKSGTSYMLDFFVGFREDPGSSMLDMAVYAAMDCAQLPFDQTDGEFGCPLGNPNYVLLGEMSYSGSNEWVNATFEFTPTQDFNVIVLGPACDINPNINSDPYYYFDRLILAEQADFGIPIVSIEGNPCQGDVSITSSEKVDGDYQWYLNGVAIIGETSPTLSIPDGSAEGSYQVVVTTAAGCLLGEEYVLEIESFMTIVDSIFCESDSVIIGGEVFTEGGAYTVNLLTEEGCDSTLFLMLDTFNEDLTILETSICPGEPVLISGETYTNPGTYFQFYENIFGCDSTVQIQIFSETGCNDCVDLTPGFTGSFTFKHLSDDNFAVQLNEAEVSTFSVSQTQEILAMLLAFKADGIFNQIEFKSLGELQSFKNHHNILEKHKSKAFEMIASIKRGRSMSFKIN